MLNPQAARVPADPVETFARDALERAKGWADGLLTARMTARFGPVAVRVEACGNAITTLALEGLRHAEEKGHGATDFRIVAVDSKETGIDAPPAWSFPATGERAHGCRRQFDDGRLEVGLIRRGGHGGYSTGDNGWGWFGRPTPRAHRNG